MVRIDARSAVAAVAMALLGCAGETRVGDASGGSATGAGGTEGGAGGAPTGQGGSSVAYGGAGPSNTNGSTTTGATAQPPGTGGAGGTKGPGGAGGATIGGADPCLSIPDAETDPPSGHCYVDRTPQGGATHADATTICDALVPGRSHLVTLGSDAEQSFVIARFLVGTKDASDAWLGLTCSEGDHPAFIDCFCPGGCDSAFERNLATASWSWVDATPAQFVAWAGASPDGAGRAAVLGWSSTWGWADRDEMGTSAAGLVHRVICEID